MSLTSCEEREYECCNGGEGWRDCDRFKNMEFETVKIKTLSGEHIGRFVRDRTGVLVGELRQVYHTGSEAVLDVRLMGSPDGTLEQFMETPHYDIELGVDDE